MGETCQEQAECDSIHSISVTRLEQRERVK